MGRHLSWLRLPWHDRGWDGHVCDNPAANVYCCGEYGLKAHGIREGKSTEKEERVRGMPLQFLPADGYRPPCLRTIQAFGGTVEIPFVHEPKGFLNTKRVEITPIPEAISPYAAGTWPYDRVFRREDEAEEGTPEEFVQRFTPAEAISNIKDFFNQFKARRSLVFFYLNYDNPLNSERRRYVLVGAAEIDEISAQQHWEEIDPDVERVYGSMVWNRFVSHGFDDGRGARIPYELYLKQGLDPSDVVVEVGDDIAQHFKYVCRAFTDDEAAMLLRSMLAALERGRDAKRVKWDWERQIAWINKAMDAVLHDRGIFPGIGPVLEALGFTNAILYAEYTLHAKGVKDPRQHVLDRIGDPKLAETPEAARGYEIARNTLQLLRPEVRQLLLDRLCLFEMTADQVRLIAGDGLVVEDARRTAGLTSDPAAIMDNPYLIVEEFDPIDRDERIPFHRIDHGIYLARAAGGNPVPGLEAYTPDDKRRLRAAAMLRLRAAAVDGHSFLPLEDLMQGIARMKLSGLPDSLGPVTFARDLDFYRERLQPVEGASTPSWMLRTLAEDEELIRQRVDKLLKRTPLQFSIGDWLIQLPPGAGGHLPADTLQRARTTQAQALLRLETQAISVLVGGAGTGKTTVLATLIKGLRDGKAKEKFILLTPTGKAAVRLRRKINEIAGIDLEPRTIHSYLLGRWMDEDTFRVRREGEPIDDAATTVILDECSMLDTTILATVVRALDWRSIRRIVFAGDPQQLPPIGVGAPFKNLVDHLAVSTILAHRPCELTVNCRLAQPAVPGGSPAAAVGTSASSQSMALRLAEQFTPTADRIIADELIDQLRSGGRIGVDLEVRFFKDEHDLPDAITRLVADGVTELLGIDGSTEKWNSKQPWVAFDLLHAFDGDPAGARLDAFEILSPYRGNYFGSDGINTLVQTLLRGRMMANWGNLKLGKQSGRQYIGRDKVLQTRNRRVKKRDRVAHDGQGYVDFYVANGELGRMMTIDKDREGEKFGRVRFETSPTVSVTVDGKWAEESLDLGYAMTVHKAQGSDFGGVIVVLPKEEQLRMVSRELLYTALTRFTRRLYLLVQGQPGDVEPLVAGLWRGASAYLRRNSCLYSIKQAPLDLEEWRPEKRIIRTIRDDLVASKSEALIANMLAQHKVPYYYERLLIGADGSPRRPDFTIPIETPDGPDVLYWEHWGKLGDPEYEASVRRRKEWYAKQGLAGKLLETDEDGGFDSKKIEKVIRERIVP